MFAKTVLIALPERDFDPTEVAISWQVLRAAGYRVCFATPGGRAAAGDPLMLAGEGLDPWGWLPGLRRFKLLGLLLRARRDARQAYARMLDDNGFRQPLSYAQLRLDDFDGLLLPGGHWARGMRAYLEDPSLQAFVGAFLASAKPVAAICHGVLLAARSPGADGRSALYGRKTTGLTWAMERSAWNLTRFYGRFWDPNYYRTYREAAGEPAGYMSVQAEVGRALASPADFLDVPKGAPDYLRKTSGLHRDSQRDSRPAWVVRDGNYLSARWPGDVHAFAQGFVEMLAQ
ncbi:type 1 glutamine amidotransferase domain-containing protein [Pseudomonas sp. EA_105y_Pfl2_R69]|uniref:type 1 glutamine amidotransferase domain-containing protein n=1 Tax=Pseudomonas sp. EA_105y_Pfl2_R69 TaxID=3088683 RepID=UPI0030D89909